MSTWARSSVTGRRLDSLVARGLLCQRTAAAEWLVPGLEEVPAPPNGYVVSFAYFHERGMAVPTHRFMRGLLHYYQIEMQHLNPNGIQHISTFVALCEGYLGIEPYFVLWKHFFSLSLQKMKTKSGPVAVPIGCASAHLRQQRSEKYPTIVLSKSNKGWHSQWFYLRSDPATPLPAFSG